MPTGDISVYFVTCNTNIASLKGSTVNESHPIPRLKLCIDNSTHILNFVRFIHITDLSLVWLLDCTVLVKIRSEMFYNFHYQRDCKISRVIVQLWLKQCINHPQLSGANFTGSFVEVYCLVVHLLEYTYIFSFSEYQRSNFIPLNLNHFPTTTPKVAMALSITMQSPALEFYIAQQKATCFGVHRSLLLPFTSEICIIWSIDVNGTKKKFLIIVRWVKNCIWWILSKHWYSNPILHHYL